MKLGYYVYEIRALLPKDWLDVDQRHIIEWINSQRALWLKNEFNKNRLIDDNIKQSFPIIMNLVERSEVTGIKSGNVILKSNVLIPNTIIRHYKDCITSTHNADLLTESYNYVTKDEAIYSGNGKINCRDIFSFIYKDYLYIKTQKANPKLRLIKNVIVEGVFEDPIDVDVNYCKNGSPFYTDMEREYPLPKQLWNYMKEQIINNGLITVQNEQLETRD